MFASSAASASPAERDAIESRHPSPTRSTAPQDTEFPALEPIPSFSSSSRSNHPSPYVRVLHSILSVLSGFASPPTLALLSALVVALIPTLKSLFVYTDDSSFHPTAPDGDPPLAIMYNTATFVGGASVPLGLTVLGSSIAKMEIPRPVSRLPLASIGAMALVKVILLPIVGFFFVEALVHRGMVQADNAVLRFSESSCSAMVSVAFSLLDKRQLTLPASAALIYCSCVPTGTIQVSTWPLRPSQSARLLAGASADPELLTSQLAFSQMYAPEGEANNSALLSAYILAQVSRSCVFRHERRSRKLTPAFVPSTSSTFSHPSFSPP